MVIRALFSKALLGASTFLLILLVSTPAHAESLYRTVDGLSCLDISDDEYDAALNRVSSEEFVITKRLILKSLFPGGKQVALPEDLLRQKISLESLMGDKAEALVLTHRELERAQSSLESAAPRVRPRLAALRNIKRRKYLVLERQLTTLRKSLSIVSKVYEELKSDESISRYDTLRALVRMTEELASIPALCPEDSDTDSISNELDNCPTIANSDQRDSDADGLGDACDGDLDGDGVSEGDNCPQTPNPADENGIQSDLDEDGIGDACDLDRDGDGIENTLDLCPDTPSTNIISLDTQEGIECDPEKENLLVGNLPKRLAHDAHLVFLGRYATAEEVQDVQQLLQSKPSTEQSEASGEIVTRDDQNDRGTDQVLLAVTRLALKHWAAQFATRPELLNENYQAIQDIAQRMYYFTYGACLTNDQLFDSPHRFALTIHEGFKNLTSSEQLARLSESERAERIQANRDAIMQSFITRLVVPVFTSINDTERRNLYNFYWRYYGGRCFDCEKRSDITPGCLGGFSTPVGPQSTQFEQIGPSL